jgi:hypothetical protein
MDDEQSVMRAADAATDWLVDKGYMHRFSAGTAQSHRSGTDSA